MKAKILTILNQFEDMIDKIIDSLNNSSNIKFLTILKQVDVSNNNILGLGDSTSSLEKRRNILKNGL